MPVIQIAVRLQRLILNGSRKRTKPREIMVPIPLRVRDAKCRDDGQILKQRQLLSEEEFMKAQDDYGDDQFTAAIGAEAMRTMLAAIDLQDEAGGRAVRRARGRRRGDEQRENSEVNRRALRLSSRREWLCC